MGNDNVRNRLLYCWNHCQPCFSLIYSTSLTVDFIATPGDRARRPWGSVVNVGLEAYPVTHNVGLEPTLDTQNQVGIMNFWLKKPVANVLNLVLLYHCSNQNQASCGSGWLEEQWLLGLAMPHTHYFTCDGELHDPLMSIAR